MGACCIDGSCVPDQSEADCASADGQWAGALTECDADLCVLGACCVGDICVPDQSEANCLSVAGAQWAGLFTHCFAGLCPICDDGDANEDGNVDLQDFARFQTCLGRARRPAPTVSGPRPEQLDGSAGASPSRSGCTG